jgi:hypothetical protein
VEKEEMSNNLPEEKLRIPIKDKSNPHSAVNLCPSAISKGIEAIPDELFSLRPDQLAEKFRLGRDKYTKESEIEEKLRIAFWREYDSAVENGRAMNMERICSGVCHVNTFKQMASNSFRLAYICTPPEDYVTTMQELLTIGLDQLRDILLQPHVNPKTGLPDARMCDVKMRIIDSITLRVRGSVATRVETKNLNLNVEADTTKRALTEASQLTDPQEIDRRLQELMGIENRQEAIDVTPKS